MSKSHDSVRVMRMNEPSYTNDARLVQIRAASRRAKVIRLGAIVFFSTETGDAWMLDVNDSTATRLAHDGEHDPLPIHETATKFVIEWQASYRIEGTRFTVVPRDGSAQTIDGYPTAEIQRLIDDYPAESSPAFFDVAAFRSRLKETGRNDPCPCGSDKKYKKCCQPRDEALVRQTTADRATSLVQRAEVDPGHADESERIDDDLLDDEDVIDLDPKTGEAKFAPEVERELDALWAGFDELEHPTTEQMDSHLTRLLALPPEATGWTDLLHKFSRHQHTDLPAVVRRIAAAVPPTKATAMSFFHWAAIEKFISTGRLDLLPEIVTHFCSLDRETYDADALDQTCHWLLAAGCETEALRLQEHFLGVLRSDDLMPYAVPDACHRIFELRVGARLRQPVQPGDDPAAIARALRSEIEDAVDADVAERVAHVICAGGIAQEFTPHDFDLPLDDAGTNQRTWERSLRCVEMFAHIAREAWHIEQRPPGVMFHGLWRLMNAACTELGKAGARSKKNRRTSDTSLLACLQPSGLERRLAENSRGILGTNPPRAHVLLEAHATLLGFARRHALIQPDLAERTERQLLQLKHKLAFPG